MSSLWKLLLSAWLVATVSSGAFAAWTAQTHLIERIRVNPGYAWILLDQNDTVSLDHDCTYSTNWFVVKASEHSLFDHVVALATTAMTVGRPVRIYSTGCVGSYPRIDVIMVFPRDD